MKFTKLKKHLAVILSAAMVFSCFPATAMAAEPSDEAVAVESGAEDEIVGAEAEVEPATEVEEAEISAAEEENIVEEEAEAVEEEIDSAPEENVDNSAGFIAAGKYIFGYTATQNNDTPYKTVDAIKAIPGLSVENDNGHNGQHGLVAKNGTKVNLRLSGKANVIIEGCQHGNESLAAFVGSTEYTPSVVAASGIDGRIMADNGRIYTIKSVGPGELSLNFSATEYIHGITVQYFQKSFAAEGAADFTDAPSAEKLAKLAPTNEDNETGITLEGFDYAATESEILGYMAVSENGIATIALSGAAKVFVETTALADEIAATVGETAQSVFSLGGVSGIFAKVTDASVYEIDVNGEADLAIAVPKDEFITGLVVYYDPDFGTMADDTTAISDDGKLPAGVFSPSIAFNHKTSTLAKDKASCATICLNTYGDAGTISIYADKMSNAFVAIDGDGNELDASLDIDNNAYVITKPEGVTEVFANFILSVDTIITGIDMDYPERYVADGTTYNLTSADYGTGKVALANNIPGVTFHNFSDSSGHGPAAKDGSVLKLNLKKDADIVIEGCSYGTALTQAALSSGRLVTRKASDIEGYSYGRDDGGEQRVYTIASAKAGEYTVSFTGTEYIHAITVDYYKVNTGVEIPADDTGSENWVYDHDYLEVFDFAALDSKGLSESETTNGKAVPGLVYEGYENKTNYWLTKDIINGWWPDADPGTQLGTTDSLFPTSLSVKAGQNTNAVVAAGTDPEVQVWGYNVEGGGTSVTNHRLRTLNKGLTRMDAASKKDANGVVFPGYIYSNSSAGSTTGGKNTHMDITADAGDKITVWTASNGGVSTIHFMKGDEERQVEKYLASATSAVVEPLVFYAKDSGKYSIYSEDEKLVVARIVIEHAKEATVTGSITEATNKILTDYPEYKVMFINDTTGAITYATRSGSDYSVKLPAGNGYSYIVALSGAKTYVISEGADLELSEKVDSKENDLTIIPVSLLTISGNIVDGDGNNLADTPLGFDTLRRMSIVASSDETYVPDVIIKSDGTYSMAVENGTEYTFTALRADDYTLKDPEQKFTASGDHDFVFELKPLNPVTISSNVLDSELATAKFYFTKLDVDENYAEEPDYVYVFKGTENIKVRDGQYRIAVNGKYPVDYYYDLHAGSDEDNIARIQFVTEFNEWVFKTDDFRLNKEYDDDGVHTYRNLVLSGKEDSNKGYLNFGDKGYIDVPITATTAQVWAETCFTASAAFPGDADGNPSIVDTSNSTDKFKTHTYVVKDSDKTAGKVRITGKGKCYFTKVWIVDESELLPYSERVEVGADKTYKTIQSAVDAVKNMVRDEVSQNVVIAIDPGNYEETLTIDVDNVTLVNAASKPSTDLKNKGVDIDDNAVRITSYYGEAYNFFSMGSDHGYDALTLDINKKNGYYTTVNGGGSNARDWNATVLVYGDNVTIKDIIMENAFNQYMSAKACDDIWVDKGTAFEGSLDRNDMEPGSIAVQAKTYVERAAALSIRAKNAYFENCRIISRQDTLYGDNSTNAAFYNCSIYGSTDYIMGEMHAVFAKCDLVSNTCNLTDWDSTRKNGKPNSSKATNDGFYVTASKTGAGRGYLLYNCNIVSTTPGIDTASTITAAQGRFGRPWNANVSEAVFFATNIGKTRVKLKTATESNEFVSLVYDDGWDSGLSCESPFMLEFGTHEIAGVDNTAKRTDWAGKPGTLAEAKVPAVKADGQLDGKNMIPLTAANAVETWFGDWNPFVGKDMTIDQTTERSTTYDYEFTKLPDGPDGPNGPDGPDGPEVEDEDTIDATTGDAILSKKTTEKVLSENKALAAAYGDKYFGTKKEPAYLPTLANFEDTATVLNGFVKGKVKKVAISMNGLNEARATVNAKVTVILPEDMREGTVTLKAVSGNTLPSKARAPKIKKKTGAMTLKALKNTAEYEVVVATATKTLTIRVINLRFEKSLKTIVLRTDNVSANEILTVRPTELGAKKVEQINKPANFLSGLWIIGKDKTPTTTFDTWQAVNVKTKSTQVAPQVMVCSNGVVKLKTNGIYKGSVKLAYVLNGKKYTTVIKFVDKEKNANKRKPSAARDTYTKAGLLTTEAKEAPQQAEQAK